MTLSNFLLSVMLLLQQTTSCRRADATRVVEGPQEWPWHSKGPEFLQDVAQTLALPVPAAQYACALLGSTAHRAGSGDQVLLTISKLEAHMSLTRKLLRLGNSFEALEAAKRSIHLKDSVPRLCLTLSHLNRAMYFACDNLLWASKTGLLKTLDQRKWSQRSFRYYLFALILNLVRDVYELQLLMDSEARCRATRAAAEEELHTGPAVASQLQLLLSVLRHNPPLLLDLVKNSCDLFIPLDRLGLYSTGSGFVGACGLTSSVLSILTIVHPWLKLKP